MRRRIPGSMVVLGAFLAIPLLARLTATQDVTEPALKAAYIYNFLLFTEWPDALPAGEPYVICVRGDDAVRVALANNVKNREISAHRVVVTPGEPAPKQTCHVLYLAGVTATQAAKTIDGLHRAPILTISDIEGFLRAGGIVQFFFEEGRLRFSIGLEAAKQARLRLNSRLLLLAKPL